ncbi:MAG: Glycosyltransferase [Bacteroidetes bacterium HLUCCA01]|nr:MAG: Glycosyltransferase [Bacteroidetes bacterium HLUCCA01]
MTIVYLHQYFKTPKDSGGTRSYEMARRFVKAGHRVIMITSNADAEAKGDWYQSELEGIEVHWLPVPYNNKMSYPDRIKAFFRFALKAGNKASSFDADLIFATSTPLTIAIPAIFAKKKLKIPMVFEVRDLWPELPIAIGALKNPVIKYVAKKLERYAYKHSKHIVTLSPGIRDGVIETGYPEKKLSVIPNSCDIDLFTVDNEVGHSFRIKYKWLQDRPLVAYTGTLGHINGVGYLAEVAKEMQNINPEVCFVVVGDGVEYQKIKELAIEYGVYNKNFFMLGKIPKIDIPAVLNAANVATSLFIDLKPMWANSANKFFDALASSTPVAINYSGWQKEELIASGAGIAMSPTNYKKAAQDLNNLLTDKNRLMDMGKHAKKLALSKFDRNKLAKMLLEILETQVNA